MNNRLFRSAVALGFVGAGLAFSSSAFAAKDDLWVSNVNVVQVAGSSAASSTSAPGNNRQLTITNPIVGAQQVSVQVTWAVAAGNAPRTTVFPQNGVTFNAITSNGTDVGTITKSPVSCDFASAAATCNQTISFVTPNVTESASQVKVTPVVPSVSPSSKELQPRSLFINFSVIQQVAKLDTKTTVPDPQCFLYQAGNVDLKASLAELVSGNPIANASMNFKLDSAPIGSTQTGANGEATLTYSVNQLGVGDYNLFVAFDGSAAYNPSDSSATLGISYMFVGFQQPINPEGNSVFGNGRVIPVKIRLADANGNPVTNAQPTVWMAKLLDTNAFGDYAETASVSAADTGNTMRYVASDNHYIYNWDLSSLTNGTWKVKVDLGDSAACSKGPYEVLITVAKKGGR